MVVRHAILVGSENQPAMQSSAGRLVTHDFVTVGGFSGKSLVTVHDKWPGDSAVLFLLSPA